MSETTAPVPAIYAALLQVMEGVANIPKTGHLKFGNTEYDYLRADDVQERINPLLIKAGIVLSQEYSVVYEQIGREGATTRTVLYLELTYIAVSDGSSLTVKAVGEAAATDDKSINKALTQAIKNSHRAQFQFASGEAEPDDANTGAAAKAPSGPDHKEQKVQGQRTGTVPPTGAAPDQVTALQKKVKEAGEARKAADETFPGHMPFATAYLGADAKGWSKDPVTLERVLKAIENGETV